MLKRSLLLLTFCAVSTGTSCQRWSAIAVSPSPTSDWESAKDTAFSLAAQVSQHFELTPFMRPDLKQSGFTECFRQSFPDHGSLLLCGKTKDREVHFIMVETMTRFKAHADSLRNALLDSLRARFGNQAAHQCKWRYERNPEQSGCAFVVLQSIPTF